MCWESRRYRDQDVEEVRGRRLWDLFYRETEGSEPPLPVAERDEEVPVSERDRDEVPAGAER
jgi:hypothetical protein